MTSSQTFTLISILATFHACLFLCIFCLKPVVKIDILFCKIILDKLNLLLLSEQVGPWTLTPVKNGYFTVLLIIFED